MPSGNGTEVRTRWEEREGRWHGGLVILQVLTNRRMKEWSQDMGKNRSSFKLSQKILLGLLAAGMTLGAAGTAQAEYAINYKFNGKTYLRHDADYNVYYGVLSQNWNSISAVYITNNSVTETTTPGVSVTGILYVNGGENQPNFDPIDFDLNQTPVTGNSATGVTNVFGGALVLKGTNANFNDAVIQDNTAMVTTATGNVSGGAMALSLKGNGIVTLPTHAVFNVTKDAAFTGNKVVNSVGDSYLNVLHDYSNDFGTSGGGFMSMEAGTDATFNISDGATLTLGEEGTSGDTDTIMSYIMTSAPTDVVFEPTLTKNGAGTLTINSNLNKYYGTFTINEGTVNLNADLNLANTYTVKGGTLNLADVTIDKLYDKLQANDTTGVIYDIENETLTGTTLGTEKSTGNARHVTNTAGSLVTAAGTTVNADSVTVKDGASITAEGALNIKGDLSSDASTVTASNATVGGTVSSTNGSTVSLGGDNLALTGATVDSTSSLTMTGGTLTAAKLADAITGGGKITLDGTAILKTTADQVFTDADTTETTASTDNALTKAAADSVNFKAGTLSLSDNYSYTYLTNIQKTMDALADSTTNVVMTGSLVDTTGISNTLTTDQINSIGNTAALDTVTVNTDDSNISIGAASSEDNTTSLDRGFSVASLDMGKADTVSVAGGQDLTLGGSETTDVITTDSGTANVNLTEGSTLTIGNSAVATDHKLNVAADVTATDSTVATNGQTTVTGAVSLAGSTLTAKTGTLTLTKDLTTSGTSTVTGDVTVAKAITGDSSTTLNLGDASTAADLSAESVNLNGGTLYLDPVWVDGTQQEGTEVAVGSLSGSKVVVGNNSTLTIGSTDKTLAEQAFSDSGLTWGDSDILSALYVATSTSVSDGSIVVDSSANADSAADNGTFKMGANSLLMVDGTKVSGTQAAAITGVSTTSIDSSAKIYIDNAENNTTYNILSGTSVQDGNGLYAAAGTTTSSNISSHDQLIEFVGAEGNGATQFSVTSQTKASKDVYDNLLASDVVDAAKTGSGDAADFVSAAANDQVNTTNAKQESALNSAAALTELAGVQHGLYAANNLFDSSVASHLTGLYTEDQDKDLWAHYIHSKENVRGLGLANIGASYDAQFNGVVVGSDFYKNGSTTAGAAFAYVDGNLSGNTAAAHTENDADYYGLALYGRVEQGAMTYLGDISYLHGSNDLTQKNSGKTITGSTDSDAYSIGVRAERGIGLGMGTLTPFAGIRYAHLGTDAYTDSIGVRHDSDDANVWMLPLGLRYGVDVKNGSWIIRPTAEVGYVWTFGDRDGTDKVSLDGASDAFGFDIADAGSWYGRLGVQAAKGDFTYGVAYQYQDGSSVQSNTWTAAVRYHF